MRNKKKKKLVRDKMAEETKQWYVGGHFVDSRKIVNFFFKTFFIGGIVGFVASFFIMWSEYSAVLSPFNAKEVLGVALFFLGYGLVFTVVAQTGFFAYLFVHRYGQSFFRSFWPVVQVLLILFALFDLIYFTSDELSLGFKFTLAGTILVVGVLAAWLKMKQTNGTAFVPALFLMIVISALELSLVLRAADISFILLMLVPVLVVNAYQLLTLQKVTQVDEEHKRRIEERRKQRMKAKAQQDKVKKGKQ